MPERPRLRFASLARRRHVIRYSSIVGFYELIGAERRPDTHLASTGHAHVDPDVAVAITILDKVFKPNLHDRLTLLGRDLIPRVHRRIIARERSECCV